MLRAKYINETNNIAHESILVIESITSTMLQINNFPIPCKGYVSERGYNDEFDSYEFSLVLCDEEGEITLEWSDGSKPEKLSGLLDGLTIGDVFYRDSWSYSLEELTD